MAPLSASVRLVAEISRPADQFDGVGGSSACKHREELIPPNPARADTPDKDAHNRHVIKPGVDDMSVRRRPAR
jgi:hypothetical protein